MNTNTFKTIRAMIPALLAWVAFAQPAGAVENAQQKTDKADMKQCQHCHVKANPKPGDAELRRCSMAGDVKNQKIASMKSEPDVVVLKELLDKYDPVRFSHKAHADMAQMGDGCWMCHHNSPADRPHPACKTCHKVGIDRNNPSRLRLKAAYHRHCIDCHRKWSHGEACLVCHARRGKGPKITVEKGLKSPYPKLKQPTRIVYQTDHEKTKVTFFHNDHTKLFRIPCENCHIGAPCEECHDRARKKPAVKAGHETCSGCHDVKSKDVCDKCHRANPMPAYSHNSTGFPLKNFHGKLKCSSCHHAHQPLRKLNADCRTCHKGLVFRSFNHALTGFNVKTYHPKTACVKCHPANRPMKGLKPSCVSCHKGTLKSFKHEKTGFELKSFHKGVACAKCHANGSMKIARHDCDDCHKGMKFDNFDHAKVGFALKKYHAALTCDRCHPAGKPIAALDTKCATCHGAKDAFKDFNHEAATGVRLDDMHAGLGCADCHTAGVGSKSDCSACHGKDKSYPKDKPYKEPAAK